MNNHQILTAQSAESGGLFAMITNPSMNTDFVDKVDPLVGACGVLPTLMMASKDPQTTFKEALETNYQFGARWQNHGVVDDSGIYRHPEDPPLPPVVSMVNLTNDEVAYIYQFGLVAVRDSEGNYIAGRFD